MALPRTVALLVLSQGLSVLSSSMVAFGVSVWLYQETKSLSLFALLTLANALPGIVVSPLAGAIVDRLPRRLTLIGSDGISLLGTLLLLAGAASGFLSPWMLLVTAAFASLGGAVQWPALSVTITELVPADQRARFNGALETAQSAAQIGAPILGGLLFGLVGLAGLAAIEVGTFFVAALCVLAQHFPAHSRPESRQGVGMASQLVRDLREAVAWLRPQRGLLQLMCAFLVLNFVASFVVVTETPFQLSFLAAQDYGLVRSAFGIGLVGGGLIMAFTGGPKRKVHGVLGGGVFQGFLFVGMAFFRSLEAHFLLTLCMGVSLPIINSSSQTLWQARVPVELQGRVFSLRRMVAWCSNPVAYLLAIPLAEALFRPSVPTGPLFGGPDTAYLAAMHLAAGVLVVVVIVPFFASRALRSLEDPFVAPETGGSVNPE